MIRKADLQRSRVFAGPRVMTTVHLLDGTYELFRAYYALPEERAPDGQPVGAIRGLIGSTLALMRTPGVSHVAAAFDHVIESFRNRLYPGYKTGAGVPADLLAQFGLAEEALAALGLVVWPMVEFEADDALATAAARFAPFANQVVILSADKDLCQCVRGSRVVVHDRRRNRTWDEAAVQTAFGVAPQAIPDLLALAGDPADGIPGLPGWGRVTAARLLARYGSVEAIPTDPAEWPAGVRGGARLAATLAARQDDVRLFKRLATLRTDVPLRESIEDLEWAGVRRADYVSLCARLGLGGLAHRPHRWQ